MRILHLTTHLNLGGIASYLAVLGPALQKRGHDVQVLSSGGAKALELEKAGIRCHTLGVRTKSELHPKLWASLPAAAGLVRKEKIDILHAHTRVTQVLGAALSRLTGVPMAATAHGFYKARFGRRLFPCWGRRVIAVSALVAEELETVHGLPEERITVVPNALDIDLFQARLAPHDRATMRAKWGIPPDAFAVGCISRLVKDKGQEYLIEAVRRSIQAIPGIFLVLVGDGREKKDLERMIEVRAGARDHVKMVPAVQDTTEILAALDVFAHPATWREGFGLSMAEAMLAGLPVVATRIPAIPTLFREDEEILLVEPKDALALAGALKRLHDDRALAKKLSDAGRALALRECRPERQAEAMEKVYEEIRRS